MRTLWLISFLIAAIFAAALPGAATAQSLPRSVSVGTNPPGTVFYALASGLAKVVSGATPIQVSVQPYTGTSTFLPLNNTDDPPAFDSADPSDRKTEELRTVIPEDPVKSYDMNTNFLAGDVINHPKFGLGSVEVSFPPNKIEVRFQEGKKLLLHNMKNFRP